jgi:hypothetical protein
MIRAGLVAVLAKCGDPREVTGVSCIARGSDTIFGEVIVERGSALEVILPSEDYRREKVQPEDRAQFDALATAAVAVHVMPFASAGRDAYEAANRALLVGADLLVAVWDGNTSKPGGTGTVVHDARSIGIPVSVVWPEGAFRRTELS